MNQLLKEIDAISADTKARKEARIATSHLTPPCRAFMKTWQQITKIDPSGRFSATRVRELLTASELRRDAYRATLLEIKGDTARKTLCLREVEKSNIRIDHYGKLLSQYILNPVHCSATLEKENEAMLSDAIVERHGVDMQLQDFYEQDLPLLEEYLSPLIKGAIKSRNSELEDVIKAYLVTTTPFVVGKLLPMNDSADSWMIKEYKDLGSITIDLQTISEIPALFNSVSRVTIVLPELVIDLLNVLHGFSDDHEILTAKIRRLEG